MLPLPCRSPTLVANPKVNEPGEVTVRAFVTVRPVPVKPVTPFMVKLSTITAFTVVIVPEKVLGMITASAATGATELHPVQLVVVVHAVPVAPAHVQVFAAIAGATGNTASASKTIMKAAMNLAVVW
jgi:hypothetical protein